MDNNSAVDNLLLTDMPLADLAEISRMAERRGWPRLKMIRHILAQAAARERKSQAPMLASAASDTPKAG